MLSNNGEDIYFVIYDENDVSMSVVHRSDVIYDEDSGVNVGDKVKFTWNKEERVGYVRFINDDFDVCKKKALKLNHEQKLADKKKLGSFHEEAPRKSKIKCKQELQELTRNLKRSAPKKEDQVKKPKVKKANAEKISNIQDIDAEIMRLLAEKEKQGAGVDNVFTHSSSSEESISDKEASDSEIEEDSLPDTEVVSDDLDDTVDITGDLGYNDSRAAKGKSESAEVESDQQKVQRLAAELAAKYDAKTLENLLASPSTSGFEVSRKSSPSSAKKGEKWSDVYGISNRYKGKMFLVEDKTKAVALNTTEPIIYCTEDKFEFARRSTSTTMSCRRLLEGVFTPMALANSSVTGLPPRCKGRESYSQNPASVKPYLCPKAINAIVGKALEWQKDMHWKPKKDSSQLRQAMGTRLNELGTEQAKQRARARAEADAETCE